MTPEKRRELEVEFIRINKWRQLLIVEKFMGRELLPWQESQLQAYREHLDILSEQLWPLNGLEKILEKQKVLAERISALNRRVGEIIDGTRDDFSGLWDE